VSVFEEAVIQRIKQLEQEVERLQRWESPGVWADWSPTLSGWAAGASVTARYSIVGKLCFVHIIITGTSNSTYARATLPFPGKSGTGYQYIAVPFATNNGVDILTGGRVMAQVRKNDHTYPNQIWWWLDESAYGWTSSGTKAVNTRFFYERN